MGPVKPNAPVDIATCYHCGESCDEQLITADSHSFCCDGCKLVYELLKENDLCNYYDITKAPGHANELVERGTYAALDEPGVREKLVRFEDENISRVTFQVPGMHCSSCIWLLEHLNKLKAGIISSIVNFPRKEVTVDFRKQEVKLSEVAALMAATGYTPSISLGDLEVKEQRKRFNPRVLKIGVAGFCFANIMMLSFPEYLTSGDLLEVPQLKSFFAWLSLGLAIPVLLYSASDFFVSAWKTIRYRSLNIDAPIALAIAVTFLRSAYEITIGGGTSYLDSMSGIVFFMLVGRFFQDRTYDNMSFERDYKSYFPIAVTVRRNAAETSVPVTQLKQGDIIIIRNNELVPTDATLLSERTYVDYSFVTGEAQPVRREKGEKIFAGARQTEGACELKVLTETSQSYLTQLWNNDAFSKQHRAEQKTYIDNINRWFSLGVLSFSFGSGIVWYFIDPSVAFNALTAVLIVACPCTLLLASTFTNGSVVRWLGRAGLYLKNAAAIDRLATADTVVFDKTGTITSHDEAELAFDGEALSPAEVQAVVALAGQSGHPLSRRIVAAYPRQQSVSDIKFVSEVNGKGISAKIGTDEITLGSAAFAGTSTSVKQGPEVWLAINGKVRGRFLFRNRYREGLEKITGDLRKKYQLELLSGDNNAEQESLEPMFGKQMFFEHTPQQKLDHIRALRASGKKVIMIGDGLNDAGALMEADAGIAISDNMNNYFPACDAILNGKNFNQLSALLKFSRVARQVVIASFVVSVMYNCVGIFYSVQGLMSPLVAAILMPASSFSVIAITTLSVRLAARRLHTKSAT